jgi:hypothetical protein
MILDCTRGIPGRVAPGDCFPGTSSHPYLHTRGSGRVDQGRFKSFQAQGNERFLTATACRDVEGNALRANLVERTRMGPGIAGSWVSEDAFHGFVAVAPSKFPTRALQPPPNVAPFRRLEHERKGREKLKNTDDDLKTGKNLPPPLEEGSQTRFDPGDQPFGLWVSNDDFTDGGVFTEPALVARINQ